MADGSDKDTADDAANDAANDTAEADADAAEDDEIIGFTVDPETGLITSNLLFRPDRPDIPFNLFSPDQLALQCSLAAGGTRDDAYWVKFLDRLDQQRPIQKPIEIIYPDTLEPAKKPEFITIGTVKVDPLPSDQDLLRLGEELKDAVIAQPGDPAAKVVIKDGAVVDDDAADAALPEPSRKLEIESTSHMLASVMRASRKSVEDHFSEQKTQAARWYQLAFASGIIALVVFISGVSVFFLDLVGLGSLQTLMGLALGGVAGFFMKKEKEARNDLKTLADQAKSYDWFITAYVAAEQIRDEKLRDEARLKLIVANLGKRG